MAANSVTVRKPVAGLDVTKERLGQPYIFATRTTFADSQRNISKPVLHPSDILNECICKFHGLSYHWVSPCEKVAVLKGSGRVLATCLLCRKKFTLYSHSSYSFTLFKLFTLVYTVHTLSPRATLIKLRTNINQAGIVPAMLEVDRALLALVMRSRIPWSFRTVWTDMWRLVRCRMGGRGELDW